MKIIVGEKAVELSDEQLEMFKGLTKLQKSVSLKKLEGLKDVEAYRQGGGKAKNANSQQASASEILCNPNVRQFIDSFNGHLISDAIMTREEMLERLTYMARTSLSDIVEFHENVVIEDEETGEKVRQSFWSIREDVDPNKLKSITKLTASPRGISIETHDEKAAMKQIADIEGFNAAVRLAIGGDPDAPPVSVESIPADPLEAAKAYQKMLEG